MKRTAAKPAPYYFDATTIPLAAIRDYARRIAERFEPDRIILFGSHAYGTPHVDSDVDLLVVMECRNQIDQAVKIHWQIEAPFSLDLIVRKPRNLQWRLDKGESFHTEIVGKGKVLYDEWIGCRRLAATRSGALRCASRLNVSSLPPRQ